MYVIQTIQYLQYSKEVMRMIATDQREQQWKLLINFAEDWMTFALEKCERGRGTRPRWATQGLDYLASVCDSKFLAYLTDEEFDVSTQTFYQVLLSCQGVLIP